MDEQYNIPVYANIQMCVCVCVCVCVYTPMFYGNYLKMVIDSMLFFTPYSLSEKWMRKLKYRVFLDNYSIIHFLA